MKKQPSYSQMMKIIEKTQASMQRERERLASVMAAALLSSDDQAAVRLGDLTDNEIKTVMKMLSAHLGDCIDRLEAEKRTKHVQ